MPLRRSLSESSGARSLETCRSYGAGRGLACAEFALGQNSNNLKESPVDLQPLTTIQQNNFTPQPPHSRDPITLTACVTTHPSTTSRQHHFHRSAPLYTDLRRQTQSHFAQFG